MTTLGNSYPTGKAPDDGVWVPTYRNGKYEPRRRWGPNVNKHNITHSSSDQLWWYEDKDECQQHCDKWNAQ